MWWHAGNAGQDWTPCRSQRRWTSADIWECQARSARAGIQVICSWSHRRDISVHGEDSAGYPDIWKSQRLQLSHPHLNDVHRRGEGGIWQLRFITVHWVQELVKRHNLKSRWILLEIVLCVCCFKVHQARNIFCRDNPQNHGEKQSPEGTHILNRGMMSCQGVYPNKRVLSLLLSQPCAACQRGHFLMD